ncbi:MAG: thioredoxin family protein [Promethearchaeota archaeon]
MGLKVEIIGPYPPCIRCHRVYRMLKELTRERYIDMEIERIYAGSEGAEKYGKIVEAEIFAEKMGIDLDYRKLFEQRDIKTIDEKLAPYVEMAKEQGIFLTPVIIVNGNVVSMGRVPRRDELEQLVLSHEI